MKETNERIAKTFDELKEFVIQKNIDYNNSLQNPISVFQTTKMNGILGRLDDKLNRIKASGINENTIDTVDDLIGYLVHLKLMYEDDKKKLF